ncbi:unnamed protein product [Toxocara canis]|uniref:RING-type domain-containing protein n=1 Tax=Toxocara canis TaxID=6265 RepID=A0A183V6D4_TOXCA|nr:unnamed protein product [Toxocara canis]
MNDIDKEAGFGDLCDRIRNDFNNMKMVLRCGICCSTLKDPVVTTCLHAFCRQCINYCIDKLNTLRCPICKQKLNKRSCGSCPQLSDMVHDYLRLVETYRHECLQAHVPEEAMFTESQVVMTENVNGTVGHSPLQETTNTARTFEEPESAPLLSDQHIKRKRVASCSEANPRLQKMIRSDADRARFEENGMCLESSAYSHLKQWNSLCRPSSKCSLSRAVGVIANSSSSLSTDSGNVNRPPYDRVEVEFMKPLKPMVAVTCVKVSDDKVKGFDVNEMVSVEQLKGRKVLDWTVEQDNGRKANLVEASSQTRNCAAEICAQHSSKSPTASALAQGREYETHDVCIQASVSPEAHGNAEVQVMQKCNGVVMQSERANILQHASVQTISECTETGVQTWQPSNELCEAFVQTDFESNSRQAGIQTDFSIYATGKAIGWVKSVAETCVEASSGKADPFRDSAGDAATKLELMVRRRFGQYLCILMLTSVVINEAAYIRNQ